MAIRALGYSWKFLTNERWKEWASMELTSNSHNTDIYPFSFLAQLLVSRKFQNIEFYHSTLSGSRDNSLGTLNAEDCRCVTNCDHWHLYCKTHNFNLGLVFTQDRHITKYYWCSSATTKKTPNFTPTGPLRLGNWFSRYSDSTVTGEGSAQLTSESNLINSHCDRSVHPIQQWRAYGQSTAFSENVSKRQWSWF